MMHKSEGQDIGRDSSLHVLHTTLIRAWECPTLILAFHGCSLVLRRLPPPTWPGTRLV